MYKKMNTIADIMDRLTELKKWSIAEANPFGQGRYDYEIKDISDTLNVFGVKWQYEWNGENWVAVAQ